MKSIILAVRELPKFYPGLLPCSRHTKIIDFRATKCILMNQLTKKEKERLKQRRGLQKQ